MFCWVLQMVGSHARLTPRMGSFPLMPLLCHSEGLQISQQDLHEGSRCEAGQRKCRQELHV